jgi:orotate phosphoribosyltransferase
MNDLSDLRSQVRNIINDECIVRVPKGSRELPALSGGGFYSWQFYLRRALLDPLCLELICIDFWQRLGPLFDESPFQLAGVESAAVPIITALVLDAARRGRSLHAFTIRKERKTYGRRNLIEGVPSSAPVLFVDDLTSPLHNAFWHAMHAIQDAGLSPNGRGYVLVRKTNVGDSPGIQTSMGVISIESPFTLSDFTLTLEDYNSERSRLGAAWPAPQPIARRVR